MDEELKHSKLTDLIIGTFYDVYNELGFGFLESVYETALMIALEEKGLKVEKQVAIPVWFRGNKIGTFEADLIVENLVIIELKAVSSINDAHVAQLLNYLKATEIEVGLVLNFGKRPEFKRKAFDNERKRINKQSKSLLANLFNEN